MCSNLRARIELHRWFSGDEQGWTRWVFDRLALPAHGSVLELGCGAADLWLENIYRPGSMRYGLEPSRAT